MKQIKELCLVFCFLSGFVFRAHSEAVSYVQNTVFGVKLIITMTNSSTMPTNSLIFLDCLTTNLSTNSISFRQTEVHGMYAVFLIDDSSKAIELNNPANAGDSMDKMAGVAPGQAFECIMPLDLKNVGIKPGHYRIVAKQTVYFIKDFDRRTAQSGELISNPLDFYLE